MKYIIELEDIPFRARLCHAGEIVTLWKAKGFNSLVFDDEGLSRLEKYDPKGIKHKSYEQGKANGYIDGANDAWKTADEIFDMVDEEEVDIFGHECAETLKHVPAAEAIKRLKEHKAKRAIQTDIDTLMTSLGMSLEEIAEKLKEMRGQ